MNSNFGPFRSYRFRDIIFDQVGHFEIFPKILNILKLWLFDSSYPCDLALSLTANFAKCPPVGQVSFGYMLKTYQIAGMAYRTSLDRTIEDLKLSIGLPSTNKK